MSRQTFTGVDLREFPPTAHAAVANTITRTNLWVPALWTPIPAFDARPGKIYLLRCGGVISTTGTPTIIFTPTFGQSVTPGSNISLGASGTITTGAGLANAPWWAEFVLGFRQLGLAAGGSSCVGNGHVTIGSGGAGITSPMGGTDVTTADDTIAQGLCLDVTWGTASASNTIQAKWSNVQTLN